MLIQNQNLFPLSKVRKTLARRYMSAEGNVFSNTSGKLIELHSTSTAEGSEYIRFSAEVSYPKGLLMHACTAHVDFFKDTTERVSTASKPARAKSMPNSRLHAETITAGIKARGWIIGQVADQSIIFGAVPVIHITDASVMSELERLAAKKPGTKFVKLRIEAALTVGEVHWE